VRRERLMRTKVVLAVILMGVLVLTPVLAYEVCTQYDGRSCDHIECCTTRYISCDLFTSKGQYTGTISWTVDLGCVPLSD
jgi:hypothetical protein